MHLALFREILLGDVSVLCTSHVYDDSEYAFSLIADLDVGTCQGLEKGTWPFYPVISKTSFLGMSYMLGMFIGINYDLSKRTVWEITKMIGVTAMTFDELQTMLARILVPPTLFFFSAGAGFWGYLSDLFGRLKVIMSGVVLTSAAMFAGSFVHNYWGWFFLRLLTGLFSKALFMTAFLISVEVVDIQHRMFLGITINVSIGENGFFIIRGRVVHNEVCSFLTLLVRLSRVAWPISSRIGTSIR